MIALAVHLRIAAKIVAKATKSATALCFNLVTRPGIAMNCMSPCNEKLSNLHGAGPRPVDVSNESRARLENAIMLTTILGTMSLSEEERDRTLKSMQSIGTR